MIGSHSAVATISPWWERWPAIRGEPSIRRSVCGDHCPPEADGISRWFKSITIERSDSPARKRRAHSLTIAASAGRSVRLSGSYP